MNSYERVFANFTGKVADRIPNTSLLMTFAARQIGVPYGKYVTDFEAVRFLSEKAKKEVPVVGWVEGEIRRIKMSWLSIRN